MPPAKKTNARSKDRVVGNDALELRDDGTVFVRWRGLPEGVLLEPPLIGEYEQIVESFEKTRGWYADRAATEAYSSAAPNAEIWVTVLDTLGDVTVDRTMLAAWMLASASLTRLIVNWRVNPLARGETEDLVAQVTRSMVEQLQGAATNPDTSNPPSSPVSAGN
jgi:hypothetical protein